MQKNPTDYITHWSDKGEYGKIRIERMLKRKSIRRNKPKVSRRFTCEMGYTDCERRGWCNGDC